MQIKHFLTPHLPDIGKHLIFLDETGSTNDALKELSNTTDLTEGTVLWTNFQTKGRGQQGNFWESEKGQNNLLSLLLRPTFLEPTEQVWLNVAISVAVRNCLQGFLHEPVWIKWPNDMIVSGKKICGLLIENGLQGNKITSCIAGIGINVNQQHFAHTNAVSIYQLTGQSIDLAIIRNTLFHCLNQAYARLNHGQREAQWDEYHQHLAGKGFQSIFRHHGIEERGELLHIDLSGRLHVRFGDQVKSFAFKEVEYVSLNLGSTNE